MGEKPGVTTRSASHLYQPVPADPSWEKDIVPLLEADEKATLRAPTLMVGDAQGRWCGRLSANYGTMLRRVVTPPELTSLFSSIGRLESL